MTITLEKDVMINEFKNELKSIHERWCDKENNKWVIISRGMDYSRILGIKNFLQKFGVTEEELGITHDELVILLTGRK